jgi:hypothetical protein
MQYRICGGTGKAGTRPHLDGRMRWRQEAGATADIVIGLEIPQLAMWTTITGE